MVPDNGEAGGERLARVTRMQEEAILAAFGDPQARDLLRQLNEAPRSAQDLVHACELPQASVYRKLKELQESGLVGVQRTVLSSDGHRTDLFRSLLAETQVRYHGARIEVLALFRDLAAERLATMWTKVRGEERP